MEFYRKLGLEPYYAVESASGPSSPGESSPFCFAGRETYDIIIGKRKIGGNAQRRLKNVIFQHGSIPVVNRAVLGAAFMRDPPQGIGEVVTSLRELGANEILDELKGLMADAFRETMSATLIESRLSREEERLAASLAEGKHLSDLWVWEGRNPSDM
jgi:lipoate-protein ligase A